MFELVVRRLLRRRRVIEFQAIRARILRSGSSGIGAAGRMGHVAPEVLGIIVIAVMPSAPQRQVL